MDQNAHLVALGQKVLDNEVSGGKVSGLCSSLTFCSFSDHDGDDTHPDGTYKEKTDKAFRHYGQSYFYIWVLYIKMT